MPEADFQYTKDNHLRHKWVRYGEAQLRAYLTQIGECRRTPVLGLEEAKISAREIVQSAAGLEVVLCMSGGVDSEAMAIAFMAAQVPFRVVIGRYQGGLNYHDYRHAEEFCSRNGLTVEYIDVDLVEFFESGRHLQFAHRYQCRSPQLAVHIEILLRVQGVPVMAGNPIDVGFHPAHHPYVFFPSEPHACLLRALRAEQKPGVPFFFCYSPELIYAFWRTPQFSKELRHCEMRLAQMRQSLRVQKSGWRDRIRHLLRLNLAIETSDYDYYLAKVFKYQQSGFALEPRAEKLTGFEMVKQFISERAGSEDLKTFDHLYRQPLEVLNPYPVHYVQKFSKKHFPETTLF